GSDSEQVAEGGAGESALQQSVGHVSSVPTDASPNTVHVQFEGDQDHISEVNEAMVKRMFAQWEPLIDVSPGPHQLPRCWAYVHFPNTAEGE
ncbi:unnamed protein product, partial [Sphacelaria rigidula]